MGGLSIILMFFFLWPLLLFAQVLALLDIALPVIAGIGLVWNLLLLAVLFWLRGREQTRACLDRTYIAGRTGGKRALLLVLRYGWVILTVWVAILALACGAYLIWRPDLLELFFHM